MYLDPHLDQHICGHANRHAYGHVAWTGMQTFVLMELREFSVGLLLGAARPSVDQRIKLTNSTLNAELYRNNNKSDPAPPPKSEPKIGASVLDAAHAEICLRSFLQRRVPLLVRQTLDHRHALFNVLARTCAWHVPSSPSAANCRALSDMFCGGLWRAGRVSRHS